MVSFINEYRSKYGVEPICKELPIAPSTYYEQKSRETDPARIPAREKSDRSHEIDIKRVWDENFQVYGVRKVWRQLKREQFKIARCTVERLMKKLGIQGVVRGAKCWTTKSDDRLYRPSDLVKREFSASRPNQLWVADITYGVPGVQGKHGRLNEPRVYLKYVNNLASCYIIYVLAWLCRHMSLSGSDLLYAGKVM